MSILVDMREVFRETGNTLNQHIGILVLITLGVILRNISVALKAIEMFCVLIQKTTAVKQVEMLERLSLEIRARNYNASIKLRKT